MGENNDEIGLNYKDVGVNIDEANLGIDKIKNLVKSTYDSNVINDWKGFGGLYNCPIDKYPNPILVSSIDGVGTKSILLCESLGIKGFYNLGQDLVNHCINDILVQGAHPLFFLDYFGCHKLDNLQFESFISGVSNSCRKYGCTLIGGETAEMKDIYNKNTTDLVGCIVGILNEKDRIIGKKMIKENDTVVALPSSGPHTNGYSLIREILRKDDNFDISDLLNPHRCYLPDFKKMLENNIDIHGLCHITGGGLIENPNRILPDNLTFELDLRLWKFSKVFQRLQKIGNVDIMEMLTVLNCGVGLMIVISESQYVKLKEVNEEIFKIGKIIKRKDKPVIVIGGT